ncbi:hypothetical protein F5Y15DRAFT_418831 [Xylariaceae sp. FL0016]|nr:hypothetical protein F5Y15DRAFT_418831 [Xylariaceae sp. FL0016]
MGSASVKKVGAQLLGEIEEGSLEELLGELKTSFGDASFLPRRTPEIPFPGLRNVVDRYLRATKSAPPPLFSVSGRPLPLLYHLISTLLAPPYHYTLVVIDAEQSFDVTRLVSSSSEAVASLPATLPDLRHLHVYRLACEPSRINSAVRAAEQFMLYGPHGSYEREWWGTVVIGGSGGDVNSGWRGWLRVERAEIQEFNVNVSVEVALDERERRQEVVDAAGWLATSPWGAFAWKDN